MKKITRFTTSFLATGALVLIPMTAHAQDATPIEVGGGPSSSTPAPTNPTTPTTPTTAGTPETGFAPKGHYVTENLAVFVGGSVLGAALGIGVITLRRKHSA